ncbi:hypothetical protein J7G27_003032 [Vibrio vulnificus]|uniref:hypothetical protein n=1 Tax=Vibrio TaxID=662 RepID=UPI00102A1140|nr:MULTISPECIES: hypothetical protein [Vibrio]EHH1226750.1 hypothetical protein [Vibrio vulnificus]EJB8415878.1 hypothetical protein [Vibrio vulnificus]ELX4133050.1 hypothetical protein [Vibrio vulnificus]ELX4178099.1 hypothetical protein [Vibrio vulnificus]MCG9749137.1 hypothetical protein [Vibrio brasiliensis]
MKNAYDQKNKDDYERYTALILEKIDEIDSNTRLKPTISQLAKLTGIHRNTLRDRQWPKSKLEEIKSKRAVVEGTYANHKYENAKLLETKNELLQTEIVHWFTKCKELETSNEQILVNLKAMSESKELYERLYREEKQKFATLQAEIDQLKKLLN